VIQITGDAVFIEDSHSERNLLTASLNCCIIKVSGLKGTGSLSLDLESKPMNKNSFYT
jgi:hypothetical protein